MATRSEKGRSPADVDTLVARLEQIFGAVIAHLREDPALARRIATALEPPEPPPSAKETAAPPRSVEPPSPSAHPAPAAADRAPAAPQRAAPPPKRRRAVIDPFALYDSGWEAMLRAHLRRLTPEQMLDVIHQYGLDPGGKLPAAADAEQLRDWIVRAVEDRGLQGL